MLWKNAVAPVFEGWPQDKVDAAIAEVNDVNEFASKLGFTCHPDDRLGFGRCFFIKGRVRVWHSPDGWVRATGTGKPATYGARSLYHTPTQALNDERPFALIDQFGQRTTA